MKKVLTAIILILLLSTTLSGCTSQEPNNTTADNSETEKIIKMLQGTWRNPEGGTIHFQNHNQVTINNIEFLKEKNLDGNYNYTLTITEDENITGELTFYTPTASTTIHYQLNEEQILILSDTSGSQIKLERQ